MAWGGMEMPFPWIGIPEMIEVPINYSETADQQGSKSKCRRDVAHKRVPGNSGEREPHLRHLTQLPTLVEGCWGSVDSSHLYSVVHISTGAWEGEESLRQRNAGAAGEVASFS